MTISTKLNLLTAKELGTLAKELSVPGWHTMRKDELINALALKARTKIGREVILPRLAKLDQTMPSKPNTTPQKKKINEKKNLDETQKIAEKKKIEEKKKLEEKKKIEEKRKLEEKKKIEEKRKLEEKKKIEEKKKLEEKKKIEEKKKLEEKKKIEEKKKTEEKKTETSSPNSPAKTTPKTSPKTPPTKSASSTTNTKDAKKEIPKKPNTIIVAVEPRKNQDIASQYRKKLRRDISTHSDEGRTDRLVLLVRDSFWLHAFWEITARTVERAKVALGMFWHTSLPIIRLFRLESDGTAQPKRLFVRDILVHGGVNNWYLDVVNPPSTFQIELGYLSREKKFYSLVSSNVVETPQQQVIDELDNLDGNWRGVADDLGRIYKLSGGDGNNQELKKIFEEQLHRPMSAPLLSRYRAAKHQGLSSEKTRRNFLFNIDVDIIVHGKTDPSVQVTIRNEPIKVQPDGSFGIRFALPEKRHVFPMEAEGSDGVETQRAILTVERNTRILETLFQEPADDD
ncbi:MAG: DUF4912 domain-containing protein [Planctomycetaceae bacterium]|nr:DUF4912 domain-containing protein [Planctomycetaceae bacterium]